MSATNGPALRPGEAVRVRATKWDRRPHWEFQGIGLGSDGHGDWVGFPPGTPFARPGHAFVATWPSVTLFPRAGWAASFAAEHPRGLAIYVDLASVPEWQRDASGPTVFYIDLDLDVVERIGAPPFIDDEDEFEVHLERFGYPAEVVQRVRADASAVLASVRGREAPFDGATADRWLAQLAALAPDRGQGSKR
ncbi:DUF402 domain-containing protein [Agromyces sp. G08B096]|uniref:DUF402 domain-containing protein n=1 Tax=Agromyces sp. G08B096 TaxID=3156399 RepID=A0AAU7W5T0_9MICO